VKEIKIAVIDTSAFEDEKTGIKKLIEANKKLNEEFKPHSDELKVMYERMQKLFKEFEEANSRCNKSFHCSEKDAEESRNKLDEYKLLSDKLKSKQEVVKSLFEKRKAELSSDINKKIADAVKQFTKEKGFDAIFDKSKIENVINHIDTFPDITDEFIKFYNESFDKLESQ
jgi:Skp family chaperone for outer membrane proteins